MAWSLPTLPTADQVKAASRHMGTAVASVLGTLAALKIISGADVSSLQASFDQISHGAAEVITGITALSVAATTIASALSANPIWQLIRGSRAVAANPVLAKQVNEVDQASIADAAQAMPKVEVVVAAPEVAKATPNENVVSSDAVEVVTK